MKAGTLFRIGLYLVGFWALLTAATTGVNQLVYFCSHYELGVGLLAQQMMPAVLAYFLCPLVFAIGLFATGAALERRLLGGRGDERLEGGAAGGRGLLVVALQVLGVYLLVTYGAALVATVFEQFAQSIAADRGMRSKIASDFIANALGGGAGAVLTLRTGGVLALLWTPPTAAGKEPAP